MKLNHLLEKIKLVLNLFQSVEFYHVLRGLNKEADHNEVVSLEKGVLIINNEE